VWLNGYLYNKMQHLFSYKESLVSYHRFGTGKKVLVAFHGYNQTGDEYAYFEDVLGSHFTVIAIDFFWHGQSEWKEQEDFTEEHMKQIVLGIARQEHIAVRKFSVCSFSMGARMARALVRIFPNRIEHFILLSPPTFSFNTFLHFTTVNPIGLSLFRYFVRNHTALMHSVKVLHKLKILNRSVYIFTSKFIGKPDRLENVFKTWFAQRRLETNFTAFAQLVNEHNIHVVLIAGKNDTITPAQKMIRYIRKIKNGEVIMLDKKHELTTAETKYVFKTLFGRS
jgi:pimeloyl-ACP methyl ester carboxylesterase